MDIKHKIEDLRRFGRTVLDKIKDTEKIGDFFRRRGLERKLVGAVAAVTLAAVVLVSLLPAYFGGMFARKNEIAEAPADSEEHAAVAAAEDPAEIEAVMGTLNRAGAESELSESKETERKEKEEPKESTAEYEFFLTKQEVPSDQIRSETSAESTSEAKQAPAAASSAAKSEKTAAPTQAKSTTAPATVKETEETKSEASSAAASESSAASEAEESTETATQATTAEPTPVPTTEAPTEAPAPAAVISYTDSELNAFYHLIAAEASPSWGYEGQLMIAQTVVNRVRSGLWGGSLNSVIFARNQFTPAINGSMWNKYPNALQKQAVWDALHGATILPTNSYFFCTSGAYYSSSWFQSLTVTATYGNTYFMAH